MAPALQDRIERDARFASRREPRAALPADDAGRLGRGAADPARRDARARPAALDLLVGRRRPLPGLVEDLLEISRFDAGAVRLDLEEVQRRRVRRQAVERSRRRSDVR